jgi:hypothetical protein
MSEGTQDALRAQIERRSIPLGYLIRGVASFCVLLIAALTLNGSLLFFGAEISAGGALAVTCIASLAETTLQVFSWGATVFVLGIDQAVAPDWLMTGAVNLSVLDPEGGAVWRTALAACDLHRVVGIAVATVAIRQLAPRTGVLSAIVASTVWTVCTLALRLLAATLLGIPVY